MTSVENGGLRKEVAVFFFGVCDAFEGESVDAVRGGFDADAAVAMRTAREPTQVSRAKIEMASLRSGSTRSTAASPSVMISSARSNSKRPTVPSRGVM